MEGNFVVQLWPITRAIIIGDHLKSSMMALLSAYCSSTMDVLKILGLAFKRLNWAAGHQFYRWSGWWRVSRDQLGGELLQWKLWKGSITHPCFTLWKVCLTAIIEDFADMWLWRSLRILMYNSNHPYFDSFVQIAWRFTESKALIRSMKTIYSGCFCSLHFSRNCPAMKIMSFGAMVTNTTLGFWEDFFW